MVERTAGLENEMKTKGINMMRRMELVHLRLATCRDGDAWDVLEERAILIEDLHLAGMIEDVIIREKERGKKGIWNDKKMIKITMDGGHTEVAVHAKRTRLLGFKGIRKMLEGVQISVTLDDRKMAVRNLVGVDLTMCGRRHNRPSMIKQDGTRDAIGLERFMEICEKGRVSVGLIEGKRMRGYIIEGRALEEAVPEIVLWVVEGYLYGEERKGEADWLWGENRDMVRGKRWEMMEWGEEQTGEYRRKTMDNNAMKEHMRRRAKGILPRKEGNTAPGAGGVFNYYQKDYQEDEIGSDVVVEKDEVADALISAVAFGGREIIKFQANHLRAIER